MVEGGAKIRWSLQSRRIRSSVAEANRHQAVISARFQQSSNSLDHGRIQKQPDSLQDRDSASMRNPAKELVSM